MHVHAATGGSSDPGPGRAGAAPTGAPPARRARFHRAGLVVLLLGCALQAAAQIPPVVQDPGPADRVKSDRQREQVAALARRRLGQPLRPEGTSDLDVLQRLLDERIVAPDDVLGLQALGVVLGDVMARTLPLHWVAIDDDLGHSRALRYRETETLFFPVTMISKRVENRETVRVRGLYEFVADEVARLEARGRPSRLPRAAPPRPGSGSGSGSD